MGATLYYGPIMAILPTTHSSNTAPGPSTRARHVYVSLWPNHAMLPFTVSLGPYSQGAHSGPHRDLPSPFAFAALTLAALSGSRAPRSLATFKERLSQAVPPSTQTSMAQFIFFDKTGNGKKMKKKAIFRVYGYARAA